MPDLTLAELRELEQRGIAPAEARRQLACLRQPPVYAELVRPCTVGDGIDRLDPSTHEPLLRRHRAAADAGRCGWLVPASGAATRMFGALLDDRDGGRGDAARAAVARLAAGMARLPFRAELDRTLTARGLDLAALIAADDLAPVLDALLAADALGYAEQPKGLLPFHRYDDTVRTPLEEHLVEAREVATDAGGRARLHLTVSAAHLTRFEAALTAVRKTYERDGLRFDVTFSTQRPSTDTLALAADGGPFRDQDGRLLLRPAGHGALLDNLAELAELDADLLFIKNIDNVVPAARKAPTYLHARLLVGRLVEIQEQVHSHLRALDDDHARAVAVARDYARAELGLELATTADRAAIMAALTRPIRVCGMVVNTGEPGGGPFWVRAAGGRVSRQIVETAEVDRDSAAQRAILAGATHFNPVFLACAVRDHAGQPYRLHDFVDPSTAIVTRKSHDGRTLTALERPGLWNGAMAGWITRFVEVPPQVFNPVKTVDDLLRPEHQP